jgi:hypothetical protein
MTGDADLTGAACFRSFTVVPSCVWDFEVGCGGNAVGSGEVFTLPNLHAKAARHHVMSSDVSSVEWGA